jgi:hypothetical protein
MANEEINDDTCQDLQEDNIKEEEIMMDNRVVSNFPNECSDRASNGQPTSALGVQLLQST